MTELKEFTKDDLQKGPYKGEQIRRWHDYLQRSREQDKKEEDSKHRKKIRFLEKQLEGDINGK